MMVLQCFENANAVMFRVVVFLTLFAFLVNYVIALSSEIQQLREIIRTFDKDYKQGNMTRLASDFKNALKEYGDGEESRKSTVVQSFLKKMEDDGEVQAMEKLETEWKDYVTALGKHYDQEENSLRMALFEGNELLTEDTNKKFKQGLVTYTTALNEFADLTDEEFEMRNGLRIPNETSVQGRRRRRQASGQMYRYDRNEQLPKSFDWRNRGVVTSVKNQGSCGSCYAFATAGALETYYGKKGKRVVDLSPQNIVDCTYNRGNYGCNGGFMTLSLAYTKSYGIAPESRYPYVETVQRCKFQQGTAVVKNSGYLNIPKGDELALKSAVVKYGPVVVGISASKRAFRFYRNGVFSLHNCGRPDHAVLVVGYGTHKKHGDYWIVKNSWGTEWGNRGYALMARNKGNMCDIASMASVPV